MNQKSDPRLLWRVSVFSKAAGLFSIAVGTSALLGWVFHIAILKSWLPGQVTLRFNAALCLCLAGFALFVLRDGFERAKGLRQTARAAAAVVALVGLLALLENLFGWDLGIDQLLWFVRPGEEVGSIRPGLISLIASVNFVLIASALLILDWRTRNHNWLSQFLAGAAFTISCFGLFDFFVLTSGVPHTHTGLPSVLTLAVLSLGVICARAEWALGGLLTSQSAGAKWLRRAGPATLAFFFILSELASKALLTAAHFAWIEVASGAIFTLFLLGVLIGWPAVLLDRRERQLQRVEEGLHLNKEELRQRYEDFGAVEANLRRWSVAGVILGILLTGLGGLGSWLSMHKAAVDAARVAHTHEVSTALETTLSHAIDVEAGAQSFAATGKEIFLEPFVSGQRALNSDLNRLEFLTAENPTQQQLLRQLRARLDLRLETAQETIAERKRAGAVPTVAKFKEGQDRMDAVRTTMGEMQAEESRLLDLGTKATDEAQLQTKIVILVTTLLGITMLVFAGSVISHGVSRSAQLRGHIQMLNANLERAIEERTAELSQSEERLRMAREVARIGTFEWNIETGVNVWTIEQLYGQSPGSLAATQPSWEQLVHPEDRAHVAQSVSNAIKSGFFADEWRIVWPDGSVHWVYGRGWIFRDESGKPRRLIGVNIDITERKRVEQALRESERRFRALVAATSDVVYRMSPHWSEMRQLSGRDFIADTEAPDTAWLQKYIHPDDQARVMDVINKAVRTKSIFELEHRVLRVDGSLGWTFSRAVPLLDANGEVEEWFGAASDVTQRKQAEEHVRQLNNELEQRVRERTAQLEAANKELEAFTYSVSHDLRAPLRHISGYSKILMEECGTSLPADAQHSLQRIMDGTRRMGLLVDDLLKLSRVSRCELTLRASGLKSVVKEVITNLQEDCAGRDVEWKIGDLPVINCDVALMKQVFENLLSNALKFTRLRARAVIEVGQRGTNGAAVIFVRDNGAGFSMKYADKLFGVFQRLHRAEDFEGTGVGLAIVQRIVQKHGGRIWVEAGLDKGATFYFTLGTPITPESTTSVVAMQR